MSSGETVATGVTGVHESSLYSATANTSAVWHLSSSSRNLLLREHETQQLREAPSVIDTCSTIYENLKHTVYALRL
jgi:hypothetical protein